MPEQEKILYPYFSSKKLIVIDLYSLADLELK